MSNRVIIYFDLQKGEINNCIEIYHQDLNTIPTKESGSLDLTTNLLFKRHFRLNKIFKFSGARPDTKRLIL